MDALFSGIKDSKKDSDSDSDEEDKETPEKQE